MAAALATVGPGVPEQEVAASIFATMMREGSEYLATESYVASGPRSGAMHSSWSERVIGAGETVLIEIGPCVKRYNAALMRTAATGDLPARLARLAEVCIDALTASVDQCLDPSNCESPVKGNHGIARLLRDVNCNRPRMTHETQTTVGCPCAIRKELHVSSVKLARAIGPPRRCQRRSP